MFIVSLYKNLPSDKFEGRIYNECLMTVVKFGAVYNWYHIILALYIAIKK